MVQGKTSKGKDVATWFFRIILFAEGKLQNNVSFSRKNVLRGLHAEPWDKYISVADEGKVLGTWVDLREGRKRLGILYQTVIDASKKESLFLVVLPMVSKFCLTKYHTAIS